VTPPEAMIDARGPDQPSRAGVAPSNRVIGDRIIKNAPRTGGAPATTLQFPIAKQRDVIDKLALAVMRKRSATAADRCVGQALREFVDEMRARGIPPLTVRREVRAMESLIRGAVWRRMFPWVESEQTRQTLGRRQPRNTRDHRRSVACADQLHLSFEDGDGP
jgi:hypothetical protein